MSGLSLNSNPDLTNLVYLSSVTRTGNPEGNGIEKTVEACRGQGSHACTVVSRIPIASDGRAPATEEKIEA